MELLALLGSILMGFTVMTIEAIALVRRHRGTLRGSGSLGNAMQEIERLFVESKQHVLEVERAEDAAEEEAAGDPPTK